MSRAVPKPIMVPPPIAIKAARWLAALAVVLVTVTGCGDLYCGVPQGDNVNILVDQDNR
jgi:hypothetical protein